METGPQVSVSSNRLVKPGINPATTGLQGKWFIHYTMAALHTLCENTFFIIERYFCFGFIIIILNHINCFLQNICVFLYKLYTLFLMNSEGRICIVYFFISICLVYKRRIYELTFCVYRNSPLNHLSYQSDTSLSEESSCLVQVVNLACADLELFFVRGGPNLITFF